MLRTSRRALLTAFTTPATQPVRADAQSFPARPITWVVPFGPGNIADASSRVVAQCMGQALGQAVMVQNRPGASGTVGTQVVARAAPDGYTLLFGGQGPIGAAPRVFRNLCYDPLRDFVPVHGLGASPNMIVVGSQRPWRTLAEFVAAARAQPEGLVYASPGIGTSPHLAANMLQQSTGVRLAHAPYTNSIQALSDVIGSRVDVIWDYPLTAMPHVREGRLRALAVTDHVRVRLAPDVPTLAECGFAGAELMPWAGIFVPARTPPAVVARLAAALRESLLDPGVREFFDGTATVLWPKMGPERFSAFLAEELPRIAALIARVGGAGRIAASRQRRRTPLRNLQQDDSGLHARQRLHRLATYRAKAGAQNDCGCAQIGGRFTQASPRKARCRPYSNSGRM